MRESVVEAYLVKQSKLFGWVCYKFKSPQRNNVPDRILMRGTREVAFIELKATGEKPTEAQLREHIRFRNMGFEVAVIDSKDGVDEWLRNHH
jgi:hypothetical protein